MGLNTSRDNGRLAVYGAGKRSVPALLAVVAAALLGAPPTVFGQHLGERGDGRRFYPDDPLWQESDTMDIAPVAEFPLSMEADFIIHSFQHPAGDAGPALNVNTLGEVPDSSWFTNRIGHRPMTVEEIARGPDTVEGPAPGGWLVTGRPPGGITPKFTIRDARGDAYIFKLDPARLPELPSSAEIISTKIFHALGYNVAEDYLVYLRREDLKIAPGAMWIDQAGKRRPIEESDVDRWLNERAAARSDGRIRVLASRFIEGQYVGEFQYYGTRSDDPNDIYPHEKMRQLRGLRVFAAWLNHDDSRAINTFDSYVEKDGRRFIKHYLLDFGSTLGSGSTIRQEPRAGYEYLIDTGQLGKKIVTFGFWLQPWMKVHYPDYPAVGNFEAEFFEPWKWKPEYPNPAFERMDEADAFWAASLLTHFTDDVLRAVVRTARISDPEAESYLLGTIIERRDKCIRYWISQTNPLDRFAINAAGTEVTFGNAALRAGAASGKVTYRVQWAALDNLAATETAVGGEIELDEPQMAVPANAWGPADDAGYRYALARIRSIHRDQPQWAEPLVVTIRDKGASYDVVGIERPRRDAEVQYNRQRHPKHEADRSPAGAAQESLKAPQIDR